MKFVATALLLATVAGCENDSSGIPPVPEAPSSLIASTHSQGIALNWLDNSAREAAFEIEYAVETGSYQPLAMLAANQTTYTHTNLEPVRYYKYRVRACNAVGCSPWSNEAGRRASYVPFVPDIIRAVAVSVTSNQATLVADLSTGAARTLLWFEYVLAGQSFDRVQGTEAIVLEPLYDPEGFLRDSRGSSFIFNLTFGATYNFRAIAENGVGADTSAVVTFTTRTN
jgi:hypothetical protein